MLKWKPIPVILSRFATATNLALQRIFVILLSLLGSSLGCCICSLLFLAAVTKQLFFDKNNFSWKQWYVWNYNVKQSLVLLQYQTIRCVIRINKVQNHFQTHFLLSSFPRQRNKTQDLSASCPAHFMFAESDSVLWPDLTRLLLNNLDFSQINISLFVSKRSKFFLYQNIFLLTAN